MRRTRCGYVWVTLSGDGGFGVARGLRGGRQGKQHQLAAALACLHFMYVSYRTVLRSSRRSVQETLSHMPHATCARTTVQSPFQMQHVIRIPPPVAVHCRRGRSWDPTAAQTRLVTADCAPRWCALPTS